MNRLMIDIFRCRRRREIQKYLTLDGLPFLVVVKLFYRVFLQTFFRILEPFYRCVKRGSWQVFRRFLVQIRSRDGS